MIKTYSDDPNLAAATAQAEKAVLDILKSVGKAESYDYGGHSLRLGEYDVCIRCTSAIAEAQQAANKLTTAAEESDDPVIAEHIALAAELFRIEAQAAEVRAKFHNGVDSERILNAILSFMYDRDIKEDYDHSHHQGK